MTFAITKYIFPLEKSISLSRHFNYVLDNPRNEEEINLIRQFINTTLEEKVSTKESKLLPITTRSVFSIFELKEYLKEFDKDNYALKYFEGADERLIFDILAESWIIIRIPEVPQFNELSKNRSLLFSTIFAKEQTDYTKSFRELSSYCHLVSLLANNDEHYHGETFLLSKDPYEIFFTTINEKIHEAVENFNAYNNLIKHEENRHIDWLYWNDGINKILQEATRLDSLASQQLLKGNSSKIRLSQKHSPKQKVIHIGGLLKTSYEHLQDPELMLLLQVSIIEYLLTRNPDTSKFNVEDSISKQFKLKCAVLIHYQDKNYDLVKLNDELSKIYDQRSDLAHGNYKEQVDKKDIVQSVFLLFKFNKHLLNVFIDDRHFLDHLKDN